MTTTPEPDVFSLNQAAKVLGVSRGLVERAVQRGLLRATESPFKSNLNSGELARQILVNAEDVRKVLKGEISLASLDQVRKAELGPTPTTPEDVREALAHIKQSIEQIELTQFSIMERLDVPQPRARPVRGEPYEPDQTRA